AGNTIHNFTSFCFYFGGNQPAPARMDVHDNLLWECDGPLRGNDLGLSESQNLSVYFYRNRYYTSPGSGNYVYFSFTGAFDGSGQDSQATIAIYHNTFVEGGIF